MMRAGMAFEMLAVPLVRWLCWVLVSVPDVPPMPDAIVVSTVVEASMGERKLLTRIPVVGSRCIVGRIVPVVPPVPITVAVVGRCGESVVARVSRC
uniref:Secreted peptide n=1 Tax=Anopheles braziliensis TaxID=58242 RepID=A0A2M3ZM82_9DIPT